MAIGLLIFIAFCCLVAKLEDIQHVQLDYSYKRRVYCNKLVRKWQVTRSAGLWNAIQRRTD